MQLSPLLLSQAQVEWRLASAPLVPIDNPLAAAKALVDDPPTLITEIMRSERQAVAPGHRTNGQPGCA